MWGRRRVSPVSLISRPDRRHRSSDRPIVPSGLESNDSCNRCSDMPPSQFTVESDGRLSPQSRPPWRPLVCPFRTFLAPVFLNFMQPLSPAPHHPLVIPPTADPSPPQRRQTRTQTQYRWAETTCRPTPSPASTLPSEATVAAAAGPTGAATGGARRSRANTQGSGRPGPAYFRWPDRQMVAARTGTSAPSSASSKQLAGVPRRRGRDRGRSHGRAEPVCRSQRTDGGRGGG